MSFINQVQKRIKPDQRVNEPVNLAVLIDESLSICELLIEEKAIKIVKKYGGEWLISGDRKLLLEVFNNLITNAVEAMEKGGTLKVSLYLARFSLVIDFEDNGHGIAKEHLSHVIEPFFSTKHLSHNYGLGLTFCYNIVKDHGGALEIESEPEKGTHVSIRFPKTVLIPSRLA
jgi:signal transduction histidine kinase